MLSRGVLPVVIAEEEAVLELLAEAARNQLLDHRYRSELRSGGTEAPTVRPSGLRRHLVGSGDTF